LGLSCSCQILRSNPSDPVVNNPEKPYPAEEVAVDASDLPDEPVIEKPATKQVEFHGEYFHVAPHQNQFDVAIILPFYTEIGNTQNKATADVMLEYYQGVKLALAELEDKGLKMRLHIYDNRNDTSKTKEILGYGQMKKMDLIIGPILESHLRIVSNFSARHKIPLFSPFSKVNSLDGPNPYFYSTLPSNKLKAEKLVEYWVEKHLNDKIIIMRDGGRHEKEFVPVLLEALKSSGELLFSEVTYTNKLDWNTELSRDNNNLVYIPSYNHNTVSSSMGKIFAVKRDVSVFGEQNWAQFEDNDYNFWSKLNVHLIASEYADGLDTSNFEFRRKFRSDYTSDPTVYSYMGYDQMSFIGEFLSAFGEHFPFYLEGRAFNYLSSTFQFGLKDGFQQNQHLYILKFEDFKLQSISE